MLSLELQNIVEQFINHAIEIQQLEDWLAPRIPALSLFSQENDELIAAIELGLAEYHEDILSFEELRHELEQLVRPRQTAFYYISFGGMPEQESRFSASEQDTIIEKFPKEFSRLEIESSLA